ncbi:MAG: apolipoprotein N-acyltransferase [Spirochaetes bacterium]|nr:apolipoprotein N-acyltransferase [Spirochaetota bacterium]
MNRIIAFAKNHYYLGTSFLIFLSFPSYDVWIFKGFPFFAWISMVPLFIYVRKRGFKDVYLSSFLTGLAGFFLAFEWIGNFGAAATGGYAVIVGLLMPSLSVFFAIKITAAEFLSRRFEPLRFLIYPSVWILVDWIETIGYLAYPLPNLGYSQYPFTPFVQLSSLTGIMGITFVIILVNYLVADLIRARPSAAKSARDIMRMGETKRLVLALALVCAVTVWGAARLALHDGRPGKGLRVAMVQSCISPWENWFANRFRYLEELKRQTMASITENPDFVVWSESATLETISYDYERGALNDFESDVISLVQQIEKPLLTGEIGVAERFEDMLLGRYPQNNAVLINRYGEVVKSYAKIHLVPFGEWVPYSKWLGFIKRIAQSLGGSSFVPGDKPVIFEVNGRRFGVLVCYEGIFHRLCRDYRNLGAEFYVNITNDGWTDTYRGHMQHFSASIFRAIENGIWYLRAGNTGYTVFIDPYGRVRQSIPILKKGYCAGDIDFSMNHGTVYAVIGDLFLYIIIGFIVVLSGIYCYETIRERMRP